MENGIIIPCYNEARRLPLDRFSDFLATKPDYIICFVNDGSSDDTLEVLKEFQNGREERVYIYDMPANGGKAEAVRRGVQYLSGLLPLDSIGFMDADLSTGFTEYTYLVNQLHAGHGRLDMTFGSRAADGAGIQRTPFRKLMAAIIRLLVMAIHRLPIKDTQCGAKVFTPEAAAIGFQHPFVTRWLFDVELFIRLTRAWGRGKVMDRLKEIPLQEWVHVEGSKITLNDSLKIPAQLLKIAGNYYVAPVNLSFRAASASILVVLAQLFRG